MKRTRRFRPIIFLTLLSVTLCSISCKSEFERLRAGGDTEKIYKAANTYYDNGEFLKAQTLYELVLNNYKGRSETEELYFNYAYTYYHLYEYILASYYFNRYATTFPTSPKREEAMFMAAYSNYQLSPQYRLDQGYTELAIEGFQTFVNTYPRSDRLEECNALIDELREKLEKKALEAAQLYYNMRDYNAAVTAYQHVLQDFPDTQAGEEIRFKIVKSQYKLAENSIYEKKKDRAEEVLVFYNRFIKKYPDSKLTEELNNIRGNTLKILKELKDEGYKITSSRS